MKFICVRELTVSSAIVALRAVGFGLLTTLSKANFKSLPAQGISAMLVAS